MYQLEISNKPEIQNLDRLFIINVEAVTITGGTIDPGFPYMFKNSLISKVEKFYGLLTQEEKQELRISFPRKQNKYLFLRPTKISPKEKILFEIRHVSNRINQYFVENVILGEEKPVFTIGNIEYRISKIEFKSLKNKLVIFGKIVETNNYVDIKISLLTPMIHDEIRREGALPKISFMLENFLSSTSNLSVKEILNTPIEEELLSLNLKSRCFDNKFAIFGSLNYRVKTFPELPLLLILLEYYGFGEKRDSGFGQLNITLRPAINQEENWCL